jgi:3-carboxy-cis,cis-muconate cycloisomerase
VTFDAIFVPAELQATVADRAWIEAMLEAERALAHAESEAGVIPAPAADAISEACRIDGIDVAAVIAAGRLVGNPAEPLVRELRARVGGEAAGYAHFGATSQDIVDTAAVLVARRVLALIDADLRALAATCAELAQKHRMTPMAGRTLLQQAVPITFGLKAAGWLVAVVSARARLTELRGRLPAQLGGAAGTLAALGDAGPKVARLFAAELELAEPLLPWHSDRSRVVELGSALCIAAGVCAKIGYDVALLEQSEVAEVREPAGAGGSSTMPHKRNPVGSAIAVACARHVDAASSVLAAALVVEHERSLGAWQSEWGALSSALAYTGGAAAAVREMLGELEIDSRRMLANLEAGAGAVMSEHVTVFLARKIGHEQARAVVASASARSSERGGSLRAELADDLSPEELDEAFDPFSYLGSAGPFVDNALSFYRRHAE